MEVLYDSFQIKLPINVEMPIEATTKQKKILILLNVKVHGLRGQFVVGKGKRLNTFVLILKKEILKAKFDDEFSTGEGEIMEDPETPCKSITRSIKDASKW